MRDYWFTETAWGKRIMFPIAIVVLIVFGLFLAACSPKEAARYSTEVNVVPLGSLPSDICVEDNKPQIIGLSIDEDDVHLSYTDRYGRVILAVYVKDAINASWQSMRLQYVFTGSGNSCNDDRDK